MTTANSSLMGHDNFPFSFLPNWDLDGSTDGQMASYYHQIPKKSILRQESVYQYQPVLGQEPAILGHEPMLEHQQVIGHPPVLGHQPATRRTLPSTFGSSVPTSPIFPETPIQLGSIHKSVRFLESDTMNYGIVTSCPSTPDLSWHSTTRFNETWGDQSWDSDKLFDFYHSPLECSTDLGIDSQSNGTTRRPSAGGDSPVSFPADCDVRTPIATFVSLMGGPEDLYDSSFNEEFSHDESSPKTPSSTDFPRFLFSPRNDRCDSYLPPPTIGAGCMHTGTRLQRDITSSSSTPSISQFRVVPNGIRTSQRAATLPTELDIGTTGDIQTLLHEQQRCSPCAFCYSKKTNCRNGDACGFCHHPDHASSTLKKWKKNQQRNRRAATIGHSIRDLVAEPERQRSVSWDSDVPKSTSQTIWAGPARHLLDSRPWTENVSQGFVAHEA